MRNIVGISGSTILSDREQFAQLFTYGLDHIEIGEFDAIDDMEYMMGMIAQHSGTYGIHSPIIRNTSKYDLIERVHYSPEYAMSQFASEAKILSTMDARYHLVHFPYFETDSHRSHIEVMVSRLDQLQAIQDKYGVQIVCEPKLNGYRMPYSIQQMDRFPVDIWAEYDIQICIDIGDYLVAAGTQIEQYIYKWMDHIGVVHLHNVCYDDERYRWIPIHPSYEQNKKYHIQRIIETIAKRGNIHYIMEHTPHIPYPREYVIEGIEWVKSIV